MFSVIARRRWSTLLLASLFLMFSFAASAQRSDGSIGGDAAPGDKVVVTNTGTGLKREAVADKDGDYRFRSLPLGTYQVVIIRGEEPVLSTTVNVRPGGTARPATPANSSATAAEGSAPANTN